MPRAIIFRPRRGCHLLPLSGLSSFVFRVGYDVRRIHSMQRSRCARISSAVSEWMRPCPGNTHSKRFPSSFAIERVCSSHEYHATLRKAVSVSLAGD